MKSATANPLLDRKAGEGKYNENEQLMYYARGGHGILLGVIITIWAEALITGATRARGREERNETQSSCLLKSL